jgi:hypothetical protein
MLERAILQAIARMTLSAHLCRRIHGSREPTLGGETESNTSTPKEQVPEVVTDSAAGAQKLMPSGQRTVKEAG